MKTEHIYVHFPFCRKKCPYCDFFSVARDDAAAYKEYFGYILKEAELYDSFFSDRIRTIYFGGGTPSLADPDDVGKIVRRFKTSGDAEVTLEVNPATADCGRLKAFIQAGVTRFSVGSQSFIGSDLRTLGRIHGVKDIYAVYEAARKAGCGNVNLDLITGIPGSTPASAVFNASEIAALGPEHISVYILTYYDDTLYQKMLRLGDIIKLDDDTEIGMFNITSEILEKHGYARYEISNFAKNGRVSLHNMNTWNFGNYIGLGASAHSFMKTFRWSNPDSIENYFALIRSGHTGTSHENKIVAGTLKTEFLFLGLRKIEGISVDDYYARFGTNIISDLGGRLENYIKKGIIVYSRDRIFLNREKFDIFNTIVSDLIF